jgi:hypothetical protein
MRSLNVSFSDGFIDVRAVILSFHLSDFFSWWFSTVRLRALVLPFSWMIRFSRSNLWLQSSDSLQCLVYCSYAFISFYSQRINRFSRSILDLSSAWFSSVLYLLFLCFHSFFLFLGLIDVRAVIYESFQLPDFPVDDLLFLCVHWFFPFSRINWCSRSNLGFQFSDSFQLTLYCSYAFIGFSLSED